MQLEDDICGSWSFVPLEESVRSSYLRPAVNFSSLKAGKSALKSYSMWEIRHYMSCILNIVIVILNKRTLYSS